MLDLNKIYNMDCLEGMKLLDDNSIDSIVTDPPYELGFMGKKWDSTGIAYNVELWQEALRVLKPGGHLLAFGGTRTYHRMVCAIEDAGFEIRDCIQWLYGSGFPKSHDISKAIDKQAGAERKVIGKSSRHGGGIKGNGTSNELPPDIPYITAPATPEAQQWQGWGTALKPANEPIVVARKPLSEKTIAENVLKWGTGGINIDGCRIPTEDNLNGGRYSDNKGNITTNVYAPSINKRSKNDYQQPEGRFPANVILDEEAGKLLDEQSGIGKGSSKPRKNKGTGNICYGDYKTIITQNDTWGDTGGASRFFYCAKASKKERGEGNNHPTVKPVSLIKYLVTLVTPPDGVCLDPFMGSGATAIACINTNRNYIGFELDKYYYEAALQRIKRETAQMTLLDTPNPTGQRTGAIE